MTAFDKLAIAAIPAVLGAAACYWFIFGEGLHNFSHQIGQEKRSAEIVHAVPLPTKPIKLVLRSTSALGIERARIDGKDVWVYFKNQSHVCQDYILLGWKELAPDGTVIASESTYVIAGKPGLDPGERSEAHITVGGDDRMETIVVSFSSDQYCDQ